MHVMCENNEKYDCKTTRLIQKKNAMHVNPKYKWFMKKKIGKKHRNWKFFQFRSIEHRLNINQVRLRAMIKNQGIFDRSKNTFNRLKFWKFEFLKNRRRLYRKQLNPSNFMNEMYENEFKCFSKTWVFNLELQNKVFNYQKHNFYQPLNIFSIKHHRKHNLGWKN